MWCWPSLAKESRVWSPRFGHSTSAEQKAGHLETPWNAPSPPRERRSRGRPPRSSAGRSSRGLSPRPCPPCRRRRVARRACVRCTPDRGRGSPCRPSPRPRRGRCGGRIGCGQFQAPPRSRCVSRRPASLQATARPRPDRSPTKPSPTLPLQPRWATRRPVWPRLHGGRGCPHPSIGRTFGPPKQAAGGVPPFRCCVAPSVQGATGQARPARPGAAAPATTWVWDGLSPSRTEVQSRSNTPRQAPPLARVRRAR